MSGGKESSFHPNGTLLWFRKDEPLILWIVSVVHADGMEMPGNKLRSFLIQS